MALTRAVDTIAHSVATIADNSNNHQNKVVEKLDELKTTIQSHSEILSTQNTNYVLLKREVDENRGDIKGLGIKVSKHWDYHITEAEKKSEIARQSANMWKRPAINWVVAALLGRLFF